MKLPFERLLLFVLLTSSSIAAEEVFDPTQDFISDKYFAGPALVYDCLDRHWVCTGQAEFDLCKEERGRGVSAGKTELKCLPAQVFATKRDCVEQLRVMVPHGNVPKTCLHPEERRRFIGFR